jgi:hypothetical protein
MNNLAKRYNAIGHFACLFHKTIEKQIKQLQRRKKRQCEQ